MACKLIYLARRANGVSREEWPRTWRSHAIFASKFPVLEAKIDWMRYCNRIDEPTIDGRPVELPGVSSQHDGVSIAASETFDALNGSGFSKEERAQIDEDELRVFDRLTPEFSYFCTESVIREGRPVEAALYIFLPRKASLSQQRFVAQFNGGHCDVVGETLQGLDTVNRYVHNVPVHEPPSAFPFHGIIECWFATPDEAVRALADKSLQPIFDDLGTFCEMDSSVTMLTKPSHRWPKDF